MTGKPFEAIYLVQQIFQEAIENTETKDDPKRFQYHMTALTEEIGEVLKADKRWKTHRNDTFNREEKLDEISDCFITLINVCLWSDFDPNEVYEAIEQKQKVNFKRLEK